MKKCGVPVEDTLGILWTKQSHLLQGTLILHPNPEISLLGTSRSCDILGPGFNQDFPSGDGLV